LPLLAEDDRARGSRACPKRSQALPEKISAWPAVFLAGKEGRGGDSQNRRAAYAKPGGIARVVVTRTPRERAIRVVWQGTRPSSVLADECLVAIDIAPAIAGPSIPSRDRDLRRERPIRQRRAWIAYGIARVKRRSRRSSAR
jgi:hypothetical protein